MKILYGLVGASGNGSEIMPLMIKNIMERKRSGDDIKFFFIDSNNALKELNSIKVISEEEFFSLQNDQSFFNISVADSKIRADVAKRFEDKGSVAFDIRAENAQILYNCQVSRGSVFAPFSLLTSNITVGKFFHSNVYSSIAHDCVVGDFVTLAPGARVNGNVVIEDHAYVGSGAVIKQGTPDKPLIIGKGSVIGMGAVVTKDVQPHSTVIGNPAKLMEK
ncbi:acetyltransferase [Gammaproteobacteria bacterium]|nr:acetyltransferase [Gammaproteobacteria bacterium]MDC1251203.1 acetyltransferase [Gammaproteobacteria bacterium]